MAFRRSRSAGTDPQMAARLDPEVEAYKVLGLSLLDEAEHTTDPVMRGRLRTQALVAFAAARQRRARGTAGDAAA